jgi:hypothetical protein
MTTYTIPAKMSGTGTIHDTASQFGDREIDFGGGGEYAVVLASYYGDAGNGIYYIAKDASEAIDISAREREFSHVIIDRDGERYTIDDLRLRA